MSENKPRKQVKLLLTSEYLLNVPAHWTPEQIIFHYGASNAIEVLEVVEDNAAKVVEMEPRP